MNKKTAFLVPVFPPHFKFARNLLKSMRNFALDEQTDLWFIFSDEKERTEFGDYNNGLTLPRELRNFENNGIINIKKLWGINQLKNDYEFIVVLDAESLFIKNIDVYNLCKVYFESKILYGNTVFPEGKERTNAIKNSCLKYFSHHVSSEKLNSELYLWFNQPCIYKSNTLDEFFRVTNLTDNLGNVCWHDFDYYIYMFYLILYHGFTIEDIEIESNYGICEASLDYIWFKSNKYEKSNIMMCSQNTLTRFNNPNLFIVIHLDRDEAWMVQVTNIKIDGLINRIEQIEKQIRELQNMKKMENIFRNSIGWSQQNTWGAWNDGFSAVCNLPINNCEMDLRLDMSVRFFIHPPQVPNQRIKIYVNSHFVEEIIGDSSTPVDKSVVILNKYLKNENLRLFFEFPDAISPVELGLNEYDNRKLAMGLCLLSITETT